MMFVKIIIQIVLSFEIFSKRKLTQLHGPKVLLANCCENCCVVFYQIVVGTQFQPSEDMKFCFSIVRTKTVLPILGEKNI